MGDDLTGEDARALRRTQLVASGVLLLAFAVGSALQASLLQAVGDPVPTEVVDRVGVRLTANLLGCALILAGTALVRPRLRVLPDVGRLALLVVAAGVLRAAVLLAAGVHTLPHAELLLLDSVAPAVTTSIALAAGYAIARLEHRARSQQRARLEEELRAAHALAALETEELRVRRTVADGLHGTLQQRLVLVGADLRALRGRLAARAGADAAGSPDGADLQVLDTAVADLDHLREDDVRGLSHLLYPAGVEMGLAQAIRMLLRRVSVSVAITLRIDESVLRADDPADAPLPTGTRVLVVRVLEEAVTNALRHGHATALVVEVEVVQGTLRLVVDDDGTGVAGTSDGGAGVGGQRAATGGGLSGLRSRVASRGGTLTLTGRPDGAGSRLEAWLPL